jgi:uncharacterized protein YijF (DUF1287 family)
MRKNIQLLLLLFISIDFAAAQSSFFNRLADSASTLTKQIVQYDPSYFRIGYPNGDIPKDIGHYQFEKKQQ